MNVYEYVFRDNNGKDIFLKEFKDKNILIVNTASNCGFTRQYNDLQRLTERKDIQIIAFPCNQFGEQEPGSDEDIKDFCISNYGISFPVALKIDVNGEKEHPLYRHIKDIAKEGQDIGWNFEKFLVKTDGTILNFLSDVSPNEIIKHI
jgi:glutathione peroxidase